MARASYPEVATAYEAEQSIYESLVAEVKEQLESRLAAEGIYASVRARVKTADSFATKALLGGYSDPLTEIGDKAGARVVVPYLRQVDEVEQICRKLFTVMRREQKLDALAYNEVGYLGVHLDARLRDERAEELGEEFKDLTFEIQVRTIAQGAWAEVAHDQLYKPPADVPPQLKRRIYRLVSLVELFDNEVEAFLVEAAKTPGYQESTALQALARLLLERFGVHRRPDRQLSLVMASAIVPLYDGPPVEVPGHLQAWIDANAEKLQRLFDACSERRCPPTFLRPESFLIFERLDNDADRLLEAWPQEVPKAWLEEAALAWEVRLPDTEGQAGVRPGD